MGAAWRGAESVWNAPTTTRFRDERTLTLAADLVLSGRVARGAGIEAFAASQLQPSGRTPTLSWRLGVEREWLPGRLRVRGGSYWEPARFAGVRGRLHVTLGGELRLFSFGFWGAERRVALSVAGDGADIYGNAGLSLGFWH